MARIIAEIAYGGNRFVCREGVFALHESGADGVEREISIPGNDAACIHDLKNAVWACFGQHKFSAYAAFALLADMSDFYQFGRIR